MEGSKLLTFGAPLALDGAALALVLDAQGLAGLTLHLLATWLAFWSSGEPMRAAPTRSAQLTAALLALALPIVGPAILAFVTWPTWSRARRAHPAGLLEVALPDGSLQWEDDGPAPPATRPIRQQLRDAESAEERMRAVMALRHMDARRAVPLLRLAFGHASEDVRLLAFGILEQREKRLRTRIELSESQLSATVGAGPEARGKRTRLHRRLAQDHWELVYCGFVSGDLEPVVLQKAREHATQVLGTELDATTALLMARIHLRQRQPEPAWDWLDCAHLAGAPSVSAAPLFAEAAFQMRRFKDIPRILKGVGRRELQRPGLQPVAEFWTERSTEP